MDGSVRTPTSSSVAGRCGGLGWRRVLIAGVYPQGGVFAVAGWWGRGRIVHVFDSGSGRFGSPQGDGCDGSRVVRHESKAAAPAAAAAAAGAAACQRPVGVAGAVSALVEACSALRQALTQDTDPASTVTVLPELTRQATILEAVRLELVRRLAQSDCWTGSGAASAAGWLRRETRVDGARAHRDVRTALGLRQTPVLAAAFGNGDLSRGLLNCLCEVPVTD